MLGVRLLAKIKIYDLAKELSLASKVVVEIAQKLQIEAKSHLSSIDEKDAQKIKDEIKNNKIDKKKVEKIELTVHSDVIDYFRQKSIENDIPFDVLIDRYLSKALNPIMRD